MTGPAPLILNVDDDEGVRYATTRVLRQAGFRVQEADSGEEALAAAVSADLVLLDVRLPGMSGFEFCAHLRRFEEGKAARVMVVTAYNTPEDRARSQALGCEVHLIKPVPPEVLEELLR